MSDALSVVTGVDTFKDIASQEGQDGWRTGGYMPSSPLGAS
jgi:hypothetical protein